MLFAFPDQKQKVEMDVTGVLCQVAGDIEIN